MNTLLADLRYAIRILRRNPGFTLVTVVTLALGIGANTAIFSVVHAILLRPLPYKDAQRLVVIWETEPSGPGNLYPDTAPDFQDWRKQSKVFESMAAATTSGAALTGISEPLQLQGWEVSPEIFQVLGVRPLLGRTFTAGETGHNRVVILNYGLWQRAFAGDRALVGRKISLDGEGYDVVGVMPRSFKFPLIWGQRSEFWRPISLDDAKWKQSRGNHWFWVLGRLKDGISLARASAEMETLSGRLAQQYPVTNTGVIAKVVGLREQLTKNIRPALLALFATVGFLLLIACVNVANLLLAKAVGRQREIAIRMAVGSGRWRLIRQLLTESVALFLTAGVAGLLVGGWALGLLLHAAPQGYIPNTAEVHLDAWVFLFTFLTACLAGALAGLIPAIQGSKPDMHDTLKESARSVAAPHQRSRRLLTAGEIALALMMLIAAGLTVRSLVRLLGVQPGFDPQNVLTARIALPESRYPKQGQVTSFYQRLVERIQALPGVRSASLTDHLPLEGGSNGTVYIEGRPVPRNMWSSPLVEWDTVMPGYFQTLRIPLLRGRDFTAQDTEDKPPVVVVNETMARLFWPNQDPVGKRFSQEKDKPKWITVVGVVGDVREYGLDQPTAPEAYFPQSQQNRNYMTLAVRTATTPLNQLAALTKVIHELDSQVPVFDSRELAQVVSESSEQQRFVALLLGLFAGLALVLAAVGIFGVISYSVVQRTHEIGIRMALGAGRKEVLGMVLREGLSLALYGVAAGLAGAWALTRFIASLLYGVRPTDLFTFSLVPLVLTAVALLASYVPARRATKVDPMVALRYE
jgi:putative ABC transport system permease protein